MNTTTYTHPPYPVFQINYSTKRYYTNPNPSISSSKYAPFNERRHIRGNSVFY